jgi:hypothetical protein
VKEAGVAIPDDASCVGCGYPLRGLADLRCPECGRQFDPADAMTTVGRLNWLARWSLRPPGPVLYSWPIVAAAPLLHHAKICAIHVDRGTSEVG